MPGIVNSQTSPKRMTIAAATLPCSTPDKLLLSYVLTLEILRVLSTRSVRCPQAHIRPSPIRGAGESCEKAQEWRPPRVHIGRTLTTNSWRRKRVVGLTFRPLVLELKACLCSLIK